MLRLLRLPLRRRRRDTPRLSGPRRVIGSEVPASEGSEGLGLLAQRSLRGPEAGAQHQRRLPPMDGLSRTAERRENARRVVQQLYGGRQRWQRRLVGVQ